MNKILDVMETDNEYKIIMDSLMELKNGKEKVFRFITLNKNLMK